MIEQDTDACIVCGKVGGCECVMLDLDKIPESLYHALLEEFDRQFGDKDRRIRVYSNWVITAEREVSDGR